MRANIWCSVRNDWIVILNNSVSKSLWQKINWNGKLQPIVPSSTPSTEKLSDHFQSKCDNNDNDTFIYNIPDTINRVEDLDHAVTIEEVREAVQQLKTGKSTCDGWTPKMLTTISYLSFHLKLVIFNTILSFRIFPTSFGGQLS